MLVGYLRFVVGICGCSELLYFLDFLKVVHGYLLIELIIIFLGFGFKFFFQFLDYQV